MQHVMLGSLGRAVRAEVGPMRVKSEVRGPRAIRRWRCVTLAAGVDTASSSPAGLRAPISGVLLILGAVLLWVAWALMPEGATNDPIVIARVISGAREEVKLSAIVQLAASAAFAPALLLLAGRGSGLAFAGGSLVLVGLMGMAADAVYHQAAYQLTAPDLDAEAMLLPLGRMQTEDIVSLVPLLLGFIVGTPMLGAGLVREGRAPRWVKHVLIAAFGIAIGGAIGVNAAGLSRHLVVLGFFGAFGLAFIGMALPLVRRPASAGAGSAGRASPQE